MKEKPILEVKALEDGVLSVSFGSGNSVTPCRQKNKCR